MLELSAECSSLKLKTVMSRKSAMQSLNLHNIAMYCTQEAAQTTMSWEQFQETSDVPTTESPQIKQTKIKRHHWNYKSKQPTDKDNWTGPGPSLTVSCLHTLKLLTVFTLSLGSYNSEIWGLRQTTKSLPFHSTYITCPNTRLPEGRLMSASHVTVSEFAST